MNNNQKNKRSSNSPDCVSVTPERQRDRVVEGFDCLNRLCVYSSGRSFGILITNCAAASRGQMTGDTKCIFLLFYVLPLANRQAPKTIEIAAETPQFRTLPGPV